MFGLDFSFTVNHMLPMFKGHNFAALRIPLSLRGHVSWNICVCVCDTPHSTTVQMQDRKKWKNGKCAEAHKTKKTGQVELFLFAELFLFLSSQRWTTYPLPVFHTIPVCLDCSPSVCLIALQLSRKETCLKCAAYSVPDRIIPVLVWFYSRRVLLFFLFFYNKSGNDDMTCLFKVAISVYYPCVK